MFLGASLLTQRLQATIMYDGLEIEQQRDIFKLYGTSSRALWTMFQVTLGGEGLALAEAVVDLHWFYTLFFVTYSAVVVFAVICIIQALFLKDTLECAANDAEMMVQERLDLKRNTLDKLRAVFMVADTSGDGFLTLDELEEVLSIPQVKGYMELLELEISEVSALFDLLDSGDQVISIEEFTTGVMRLKGEARSLDVVCILRNTDALKNMVTEVDEKFIDLSQHVQKLSPQKLQKKRLEATPCP